MTFTSEQIEHLYQLEFTDIDIKTHLSTLDKDALLSTLSSQKRKLSLQYHPDKHKNNPKLTQRFLKVNEAYDALVKMDGLKPSIFDMVSPVDFDIPLDCIDLRMEEQIEDYLDKIQGQFLSLSSQQEKQDFVDQHQSFLQLVDWLNKNRSVIDSNRLHQFSQLQESPSLWDSIYFDWNQLLVKHFAEENLDDITYREAIMLGHYSHILALRKLISPLKWLSFLTCSLYDLLTITMMHYFALLIRSTYRDLLAIPSSWERVVPFLLNAAALVAVSTIPFLLVPWPYSMLLFTLPLVTRTLYCLANPINQIIRPVSNYFNISPIYAAIAVGLLGAFGSAAFLMLALSASSVTTLVVLSSVLGILDLIATVAIVKKLYEIAPDVAVMMGCVIAVSYLLNLFTGISFQPSIETLSEALMLFVSSLSNLGMDALCYIGLSKLKDSQSELYTTLPYPEERAPENIKQVVNNAVKKTHWSHTLFNTPINPEVQNEPKPMEHQNEMDSFCDIPPLALMFS